MRTFHFLKVPGGFRVKETENGSIAIVQFVSFETGFRRMTELRNEGFRESGTDREYVYSKEG